MKVRSDASAQVYRNHLARFCKALHISPRDYAALPEKEQADLLQDYIFEKSALGRKGKYLEKYVTAVKGWLRHNGKTMIRRISVPIQPGEGAGIRIPSREEFLAVRGRLAPHSKIRLDLIALSGQRPEVLGDFLGKDGLVYGDIEDLVLWKNSVAWRNKPALVRVRSEISKIRQPYFFFLAPETCDLIATDIRNRRERGETITSSSPVIGSFFRSKKGHIRRVNVVKPRRVAMNREGVTDTTPYAWRSYFSHFWMRFSSKGEYGEFFMGHDCGIGGVYRLRKKMPQESEDAMRAEYLDVLPRLLGQDQVRATPYADVASTMLRVWGLSEDQVGELKLAEKSAEEIAVVLQEHVNLSPKQATPQGLPVVPGIENPAVRQRIVTSDELADALAGGWVAKMMRNDGRIVVEAA